MDSAPTVAAKWYEGGTLHQKGALDWQQADRHDKVATCGDFITKMWQGGNLAPKIANNISVVDDVRPYAEQLADEIDAAFAPETDPDENRKLYTNQTVSGTATLLMITMGWLQT